MANKAKGQSKTDLDIVEEAKKFNNAWETYYKENNRKFHYDTRFTYDEEGMWDDDQKEEYELLEKPIFSFNMLIKYINNICGEYALSLPDPKVTTRLDTPYNPQKISMIEGMLAKIDSESRSDIVKQTAMETALVGGYGARRILVVPENTYSFNYEILQEAIIDPTKCCWDVSATKADKHDGDGCIQKKRLTHSQFKKQYPKEKMPTDFDDASQDNSGELTITEKYIWIADYYRKEYFNVTIYQLDDEEGTVVSENQLEEFLDMNYNGTVEELKNGKLPVKIEKEDIRQDYVIHYYKLTGDRILDRAKWDGKTLPIIFQPGILKYINGRETTISFIRYVKDAQRLYNWSRSENALRISLDRYERIMAPEQSVEGHEDQWKQQFKAKAALIYKYKAGIPIPQALPRYPRDPGIQMEMQQSLNDIQGITGRFEANIGAEGAELSGRAMINRQGPSNMSVMPFFTNARITDESMYLAILELMPKIYDTTRPVVLNQKDGSQYSLMINDKNPPENLQMKDTMIEGDFGVTVKSGPSFEIQQKESVAFLLEWLRASPQLSNVLNPVIAKNLNIRGADLIQEGIKKQMEQPQQPNPELELRKKESDINEYNAQTNRIVGKSMAAKNEAGAQASLENAETDRIKVHIDGAETGHSLQAEDNRTQIEGMKTIFDLYKEEDKQNEKEI